MKHSLGVSVIDSEQCQEAYSELLSLYDAERHQSIPPQADAAGVCTAPFGLANSSVNVGLHIP